MNIGFTGRPADLKIFLAGKVVEEALENAVEARDAITEEMEYHKNVILHKIAKNCETYEEFSEAVEKIDDIDADRLLEIWSEEWKAEDLSVEKWN